MEVESRIGGVDDFIGEVPEFAGVEGTADEAGEGVAVDVPAGADGVFEVGVEGFEVEAGEE